MIAVAVGIFSGLLLLMRRSTRPEQLAMVGIIGAASFHSPQGVVLLTLTLLGVAIRGTWVLIWVGFAVVRMPFNPLFR